jgi:hypothetical protein
MKHKISLFAFGHATSLFLMMSFSICVAFGLLFPEQAMYEVWLQLLPGFEWISWQSFLLGGSGELCIRLVHRADLGAFV